MKDKSKIMNTVFDKNIGIEYPDDFYVMDSNELKKYFASEILRFGARSEEKHIILSVGKMKFSILNLLTDAKSVLCGAEHRLKTLNAYLRRSELNETILGKKAKGIQFEYEVEGGIKQLCEMAVVKVKGNFYVVYCMARLDDIEEATQIFKTFRNSLKAM